MLSIHNALACVCLLYIYVIRKCEAKWPEAGSNQPYVVWEDCLKSEDAPIGTSISDTCLVGTNADGAVGTGYPSSYEFDFHDSHGYLPECPRGCFSNSIVTNCTQCEWPFSTTWEQSPYCDIVQLVSVEHHMLAWIVISVSAAAVFGSTLFVANGDVDTIQLSCVSAFFPLLDTVSDIGMIFMAEIFNLTYINTSHTNGVDQTSVCTGLGPFSLWTTFFVFIFVVPNLEYIKYVMYDCRIKSRLNLIYPYPLCGVNGIDSNDRTFINRFAEMVWNASINVAMLPWIIYGAFLHQAGLLGINCYWNYWITVWCGHTDQCRPLYDSEGRAKVNARLIQLSQTSHFYLETVPMTFLYIFDLSLRYVALVDQDGNLNPSVVPFAITLLTFFAGIATRLLRCCFKEKAKATVTVSLLSFFKREFPLDDKVEKIENDNEVGLEVVATKDDVPSRPCNSVRVAAE